MKKAFVVLSLVYASFGLAQAQQARIVTAFMGAQFFDTDSTLETSPAIGARYAWISRSGHGFEFTFDYTETRAEKGQVFILIGFTFTDPQTVPEQFERVAATYNYVARGGVVRPYAVAGIGYVRADIALSQRADRLLVTLNRTMETHDNSITYEAGTGVLVGDDRLRFRYDVRLIRIAELFNDGGTSTYQTTGGFSWVF